MVANLPVAASIFVGRDAELGDITHLLADPACRLLTLVGPGGIGKTRLAIQAADQLSQNVYFVPLAPVSSPDLIAAAIASVLEVSFYGSEDPQQQIIQYLREKQMVLIMDNFEHLLEGTDLLTDVLQSAAGVKFLVTTRERLNVQEEWVLTLDGLSFPKDQAADPLETYSAVQLFVQRASQVQVGFSLTENAEAVQTICQLVEGMPLGLELAATWVRAMSCRQIATQIASSLDFLTTPLRNVPERHRSLRAVFEQSWNLLSSSEQDVQMRLSVFRGGFDLEAAEQVAGASVVVLAGLVDKSLIRLSASGRYDLHELLRQYTAEKLDTAGETATTANCHLDYYLKLAEQAEAHAFGRGQIAWFDRIELEMDNLRAALAWSLGEGDAGKGLALVGALGWFFSERLHEHEGFTWLERVLAASPNAPASVQAKALQSAGRLADTLPQARGYCEQAIALARTANDRWNCAWALSHLGIVENLWDFGQAAATFDESLRLFRELEDTMGVSHTLIRRSWVASRQRDYAYMRTLIEEALIVARAADDKTISAWALYEFGQISEVFDHDLKQAKIHYENGLSAFREVKFWMGVVFVLTRLGLVEHALGNDVHAESLFREVLALRGRRWPHDTNNDLALVGLANVARGRGSLERAANLLAAVNTDVLAEYYTKFSELDNFFDDDVASVRTQMGEDDFGKAWMTGKTMTRERAIAYALEDRVVAMEPRQSSSQMPPELLSSRELEVLRLIADGLSNGEIANHLTLAMSTVKWHINEIFNKLDATSRTQAIVRARNLGLLS